MEVRDFEADVWAADSEGTFLLEIIDSVLQSGVAHQLAVQTSMHDLLVVPRPVEPPPVDVLFVYAPSSGRAATGNVLIEYRAVSGRNTAIERPANEAVRLFWRFLHEKFGIEADN